MRARLVLALWVCLAGSAPLHAQEWDSIRGAVEKVGEPGPHWFLARGRNIGYLVDGDAGEVLGTMTLSMFTPAMRPHLAADRIYAYGSYYSRTYYGDRTDVVTFFDRETMAPVDEVIIPPKSAGIGHSGMIGLVDDRFLGVWNITPAMSVSMVDVRARKFIGEISTPGCAMVYPLGRGFLMPCGDGTLQYVALKGDGTEASRMRSEVFFSVSDDPVFDYAVPTKDGWLFITLDGLVREATLAGGRIVLSEPWSLFGTDERTAEDDEGWRIGGGQMFAYNAPTGLLVTLMHEGGGQETFEEPGTEVWAFNLATKRRGYRLELDGEASSIGLTADASPLLVVMPDEGGTMELRDAMTGALKRTMKDMRVGMMQPLQ